MNSYVIGADIGTSSCKLAVLDEGGRLVWQGFRALAYESGTACAEVDPDVWWEAFCALAREAVCRCDLSDGKIDAVGISGSNATVTIGKSGSVIGKAILQLDRRASRQYNRPAAEEAEIVRIAGNSVSLGFSSAPNMLWLKERKPKIFDATEKFLTPVGYMNFRLTGKATVDYSRASTLSLLDIRERNWSDRLCRLFGIPAEMLPTLCAADEIIGTTTPPALADTGIPTGVPVIGGCMDTVAAAVGSGISREAAAFAVAGTIGRIGVCHSRDSFDERLLNSVFLADALWLSQAICPGKASLGRIDSARSEHDVGTGTWQTLAADAPAWEAAAESPPGAGGVFFLPSVFQKSGTGGEDGCIYPLVGVSRRTGKEDIIRAVLEGICFGFKAALDLLDSLGYHADELPVCGGMMASQSVRRIFADITNKSVVVPATVHTEAIGAAVLAGLAVGTFYDRHAVLEKANPVVTRLRPDARAVSAYAEMYERYRNLRSTIDAPAETT